MIRSPFFISYVVNNPIPANERFGCNRLFVSGGCFGIHTVVPYLPLLREGQHVYKHRYLTNNLRKRDAFASRFFI